VNYTSKGTCPGGHGTCLFFSPAATLTFDHRRDETVRYSGTTGGYYYTLPYPSPTSPVGSGAPNEHNQAVTPYRNTLTSADEAQLKARIGLMDYTGNLPGTYTINIRNQIPNTANLASPFSSPIRYSDIWGSILSYATPSLYTPTAKALERARTFFANAYCASESCRPNYAVLITDGEDTMGMSSSEACSGGYPACGANDTQQIVRNNRVIEQAAALNDNTYHTVLYTVGVGIPPTSATNRKLREVLRRAADQNNEQMTMSDMTYYGATDCTVRGSGRAYFAEDATQLAAAISNIFDSILEGNYVFTSPTVSSVRTSDRNYLFMGTFQPVSPPATLWEGHLYSYSINSIDNLTLRWDSDNVISGTTGAARRVYSASVSGSTWSRLNFGDNPGGATNGITYTMLGVANDAARDNVVNYVRGNTRTPPKFGDIYHSKPVLVGEPSPFYGDAGYSTAVGSGSSFLQANQHRQRVVFAGANDGTLHAFDAGSWSGTTYTHGTGGELFAYVPKFHLSTIKNLLPTATSAHRYWVDGSARVADVWIPADNTDSTKETSEWKTVLVAGLRKGGAGYVALDITDPSAVGTGNYPKVLWEYSDPTVLADSWSEPYIAKVRIRNQATGTASQTEVRDRWVAIVGGGVSDSGDVGDTLIVLDLASGAPLKVFGPTGIDNEVAASPTVVLDASGYVRYIFVPDLSGNLYRFNLTSVGTRNTGFPEWNFYKVFAPSAGGAPAYHRAEIATVTESQRYVYFGTGNQDFPVSDTQSGKFYGIFNVDTDSATIPEASLTTITTANINSTAGNGSVGPYGWKLDLGAIGSTAGVDTYTHSGEKVLSDPVVFSGNVYFTTYTPTSSSPCTGGGISRLYGLNYQTAGGALIPDAGETPVSGNTTVSRHAYSTLGVASSPSLSINPSGMSSIFVGFSGVAGGSGTVKEIQIESPSKYKNIKSWKEIL
jgi:type IV pilus assembly protein PilY1